MRVRARHYETGQPLEIATEGTTIGAMERADADAAGEPMLWVAPAFWDIQTNGRWGISFSDPGLTVEQVVEIVRAQAALGNARICPTLITAPLDDMRHGVRTIAAACAAEAMVASRVLGIHLEGPFISERDGYRGAHPLGAVRDPDWDDFESLQEAAGGRVVLVTLAPERPGAVAFIARAVRSGVAIALGHTAADGDTLRAAVRAGARLSTHLGNGIAASLPRHPNPIWDQAALDELSASFIADGHHLDRGVLRVLARAKGAERVILVSDASPLAGLPPGRYGEWAVDPSGKIVVAGTPYLAGSNQGLATGIAGLLETSGFSLAEVIATATANPARLLGREAPRLAVGQPANLLLFRFANHAATPRFALDRVCVDGVWVDGDEAAARPQ